MNPQTLGRIDGMSASDRRSLADSALALRREAQAGAQRRPLLGRNVGLLCASATSSDAVLFTRAANELGARVAHIRPTVEDLSDPSAAQATGRVLGRLYDAIECQGLPPELVSRLRDSAGVPVFDGLASAELSALPDNARPTEEGRLYIVQAVLLATIVGG